MNRGGSSLGLGTGLVPLLLNGCSVERRMVEAVFTSPGQRNCLREPMGGVRWDDVWGFVGYMVNKGNVD